MGLPPSKLREHKHTLAGFNVVADDSIKPGMAAFVSDGRVIGILKNIGFVKDSDFEQLVAARLKRTFWRIK